MTATKQFAAPATSNGNVNRSETIAGLHKFRDNQPQEQQMFGSFNFARPASRFLIIAALVAVSVPTAMTIGTDGAAYAQGRGGGGGGSGDGGGDGDGGRKRTTIIDCADCTGSINLPPKKPEITYIKKNEACEIRTCEIKAGARKCSSEMADLKVCSTKRS
jgi:hypothetical protein